MLLANPIYDAVFKYLLDDNEVAKLIVSAILNLQIDELELQPQEVPLTIFPDVATNVNSTIHVMRIDFKAKIQTSEGEQVAVLIELQKAKAVSDIGRFRRYLGSQYLSESTLLKKDKKTVGAMPIISIYLLGYKLESHSDIPILNINRKYIDNFSKKTLVGKDPFIECLTHDSVVVQIPVIKQFRRSKLEKLLNIFSLADELQQDVNLEDFPEEYTIITNRLLCAFQNDIVKEAALSEREQLDYARDNEVKMTETLAQLKQEQLEKLQERQEKESALAKLRSTATFMKKSGMDSNEISSLTGFSIAEIQNL